MDYDVVIGLEMHAELLTNTKLFCGCSVKFASNPNTNICPICSGEHGALPDINRRAVELAVKAGYVLNCKINNYSRFDKKSYFYHDLPKGFQTTQMEYPICIDGELDVDGKKVLIKQIHIEEDTGKSTYSKDGIFVDYNRCGIPLIEIVTEPCLNSSKEVKSTIEKLGLLLKYADICDMKMEEGSFRIDINISLNKNGDSDFGTRVEIKNLGSIKSVVRAVEFEIKHQKEILSQGNAILSQTKRFDEKLGQTISIREKEVAKEYKYIREYNINPLYLKQCQIDSIIKSIKELPHAKKFRFMCDYGIKENEADILINKKAVSTFFESCVYLCNEPIILCKFIINEVLGYVSNNDDSVNIKEQDFVRIIDMFTEGKISASSTKIIIKQLFETDFPLDELIKAGECMVEKDEGTIKQIVQEVLESNEKAVHQYMSGNEKIFGFFMGECSKKLKGNIDVKKLKKILINNLSEYEFK